MQYERRFLQKRRRRATAFLNGAAMVLVAAVGCGKSSSDSPTQDALKDDGGAPAADGAIDAAGDGASSGPPTTTKPVPATFAELGVTPFDADTDDLVGPNSWESQYGKLPEIVPAVGASFIDVAIRNTDESKGFGAVVVRLEPNAAGGWHLTRAFQLQSIGNLLGFARSENGSYFYATGSKDPDVTKTFPVPKQHRPNLVHAIRFDADGKTLFDIDVDMARASADANAEPIVSPGWSSSARMAVTGGVLALVHGIATEPDSNGTRHQKAMSTFFDANTGAIRKTSSIWVSHSFDQRYLIDGTDLYEQHLGDAFPRGMTMARVRDAAAGEAKTVFHPKGATGNNDTFTRLGNLARIDGGDAAGSFLELFATERTTDASKMVSGSRDLALVRLGKNLANGDASEVVDTNFGTAQTVSSGGADATNHVLYLTNYDSSAPGAMHAERPKLVPIGNGQFIVLYEEWALDGDKQTFDGTFAMRIDGNGKISAAPKHVSDHHLPRGDDAFAYSGGAAWITGDKAKKALTVHLVGAGLDIAEVVVP